MSGGSERSVEVCIKNKKGVFGAQVEFDLQCGFFSAFGMLLLGPSYLSLVAKTVS